MSDSKLHLMSFAPVPDTKTTVHVVGLPDSLRDALFALMPPRKEGGYLNTKVLKDDLRCWLDRAVELNPYAPTYIPTAGLSPSPPLISRSYATSSRSGSPPARTSIPNPPPTAR